MPHIDILAEVAARDPEVVLIERLPSEMPADENNADQNAKPTWGALDNAEPDAQAATSTMAAGVRAPRLARCAARRPDARAPDAQPRAAARTTATHASSTSSPSTREAPLVASPKA